MMKFGLLTAILDGWNFEEVVEIASEMGFEAVNLLKEGIGNRVVAYKQGALVNYDIYEALNMTKSYDEYMYLVATTTAI